MGLDSIELLFFVEDTFSIRFNASEAEQINTVQDFSNSVYDKIVTKPNKECVSHKIFKRFKESIQRLKLSDIVVMPETKLSELFPNENLHRNWKLLETDIGLQLPELSSLDFSPKLSSHVSVLGVKIKKRSKPVLNGNVQQLIDWVISLNYNKLINIKEITSKYEVERIICGIIYDRMGVRINEIELEHSITYDLGID
ncbi:acyl carrier protein [Flammeovirga yaeyamensis]|uniref:Acyl carrier protein n=1 Tax=Flammeovirga yaeyamensis TaxID=367791 RepID=A0AAX1NDB6_9BACT|nr:acyl carrier protein [Flammeovirga yaeyamensis]MBB3696556.1 hypothetical protein [Flammeovirga yaeyamensis]NMF33234.1 acyl carrier protein [Flammeovirga yaeyamensis]QWG05487.1 acyl carrier protein [Flammeovirga yaeyamensis]